MMFIGGRARRNIADCQLAGNVIMTLSREGKRGIDLASISPVALLHTLSVGVALVSFV